MDELNYEALEGVFIENDYHFLRAVTEHTFELCRGETSRFTVRRTRLGHVPSLAHFVANSLRLTFDTYPPAKADVCKALKDYRFAEVSGGVLLDAFRGLVAKHKQITEDVEAVFMSFGSSRWAAHLVDEWNLMLGVFRTDTEMVFLEWFTTA